MINDATKPGKACLLHGMAERLGTDVASAFTSGDISATELSEMISRCDRCSKHDPCILWLLEDQGTQKAAPDYCLNTQELNYLRVAQSGEAAG